MFNLNGSVNRQNDRVYAKSRQYWLATDFTFQQDGANCHTADISMATIEKLMFSVISPNKWPANSPDLNPLDYLFWNEGEERLKGKK